MKVLAIPLLLTVGVWAALAQRVMVDPVNHVGVDPLYAVVVFVVVMLVAWRVRKRLRPALLYGVVAYSVLSVAALVALDRANVLVEYERWLKRGGVERPCGPVVRRIWACYAEK